MRSQPVADRLVDGQQVLELVQGEQVDLDDEVAGVIEMPLSVARDPQKPGDARVDRDEAFERFRVMVTARYAAASGPLNLAALAHEVRRELGRSIDDSGWFGFGGFARSLDSLDLPHLRLSQYLLWDDSRHGPAALTVAAAHGFTLPEPMARLTSLLNLARLTQESWPQVYQVLSDYATSHHFSLTEATRWSRDRLVEQDVDVSRGAVGFVTRGASFGGFPLYRQPPPTAAEIGAAFVDNVLSRADAAAIGLTAQDTKVVRSWLGVARPEPYGQKAPS